MLSKSFNQCTTVLIQNTIFRIIVDIPLNYVDYYFPELQKRKWDFKEGKY